MLSRISLLPLGSLPRTCRTVFVSIGGRQVTLEEDALAQAGLGHLDAVEPARLQHRAHDDGAGQDDVGPRGLDAVDLATLGGGQLRERVDQVVQGGGAQVVALHTHAGQLRGGGRGRREVAHRAADADQPIA